VTKQEKAIIAKTADFVKKKLAGEGTGHDWWHIQRVWKLTQVIGKKEGANLFIAELGALLHDIADWKFNKDGEGAAVTSKWLKKCGADKSTIDQVVYIVQNISYKGGVNKEKIIGLEGKVAQDADRLEAIGAIGIARAFAYGGYKNRPIHDPGIKPRTYKSVAELKRSKHVHTSINHFYEKLLRIKNLMNTKTGSQMANRRDKFIRNYLKEFYNEWNGKI